jgi:hypothetical protein
VDETVFPDLNSKVVDETVFLDLNSKVVDEVDLPEVRPYLIILITCLDQMRGKGRGFGEVRHDYQIPYGVYGVQPAEFPNFSQQSNRGNASNGMFLDRMYKLSYFFIDYVDPYAASNVYGSWQSNQGNAHQGMFLDRICKLSYFFIDYVDPYDTSGQDVYGSWQSNQENAHQGMFLDEIRKLSYFFYRLC